MMKVSRNFLKLETSAWVACLIPHLYSWWKTGSADTLICDLGVGLIFHINLLYRPNHVQQKLPVSWPGCWQPGLSIEKNKFAIKTGRWSSVCRKPPKHFFLFRKTKEPCCRFPEKILRSSLRMGSLYPVLTLMWTLLPKLS
jgi:hypothetical protein